MHPILTVLLIVIAALYLFDKYIPPKLNRETPWKTIVAFIVALITLAWLLLVVFSIVSGGHIGVR